ncbi:MAG: isoleucine--tRNA ligase [Peptoniphilaceae bacterium]|nr:isoleucine--tRNA ligase [Peptoniphilaceae bacterium]MDY6019040.1 isoleucine--tRNA ligase [Anaerococcus sp.]
MASFESLNTKNTKEREKETAKYWQEINLLQRTFDTREDAEDFIIYDGPPTANGKPGIHHVIARTLKDMTSRYKNMSGYKVMKKAGWDTHGLPVEIEVEKQLGFHDKNEIEAFGIEKFNQLCKDSVFKYSDMWRDMSDRMAFLYDMDNPYITLDNDYIETEWWLLNNAFKKGLIYEGAKVMPYCPRCGTGLASHEVAQGYQMDKTITLICKFKKLGTENEYFLAWTTTPWTLPSNVGLTVNPDLTYVKVYDKNDDAYYYLAKTLVEKVMEAHDYEIVEEMKGSDLEYVKYEQLMPEIKVEGKAFFLTCADYVSAEEGTGIVHTAPAFGEDDYQLGRKYDLAFVQPVDLEGKFTDGLWKGRFIFDTNEEIFIHLRDQGKVFKKQTIEHNYPHCWRCGTPLIYYAKPSWYIEMSKLSDQMVENNKTVKWYPPTIGEKRFGNWLENVKDWAISRSRYWGTPLNIWRCDDCGHTDSVGSRAELKERAIEDIDENIELHRPYVDQVTIRCPECGGLMHRVEDVIDVWFDSGSMPFAQLHYPFENKDVFEEKFPADFICEGIDQTRGWFYSLMAISTFTTGKSPFKSVLVNDLVLDKNGQKMSKSKGNTLDPFELFDKYGADAVRFYSLYVSPPWFPTKFDEKGLKEVKNNFFRTIENVYSFFVLYANTDSLSMKDFTETNLFDNKDIKLEKIDKWLYSRLYSLQKDYHQAMEIFDYNKVVHIISDFVVEDFSNWYIRRNRKRFWASTLTDSKKAVYKTTYDALVLLSKMVAPIAPFIAEEIFRNLTGKESVHVETFDPVREDLIDKELEDNMDLVRKIVALGRASREKEQIKVRQVLEKIVVDGTYKEKIGDLVGLIKEELNIKEVEFADDLSEFMDYYLKPNFREIGKIFKSNINDFAKYLKGVNAKEFVDAVKQAPQEVKLGGEVYQVTEDYLDVRIQAKEGFDVEMDSNVFVVLDTEITKELKAEGYAREFISKVQNMRKDNGYEVTDRIDIFYSCDDDLKEALLNFEDQIKKETLADSLVAKDLATAEIEINDKMAKLELKRK